MSVRERKPPGKRASAPRKAVGSTARRPRGRRKRPSGERHVALLVEDDLEMAEEVRDLLSSLGYECMHAATQDEALKLVERGKFCFVLLDLQIKVSRTSIKPRVEAGQTLLERIRERYPDRNRADKHVVPVLVMSGHAKDHHYVVRAFQDGADDFIPKPFSVNVEPVDDRIRKCLVAGGRADHRACVAAATAVMTLAPSERTLIEYLRSRGAEFTAKETIESQTRLTGVQAIVWRLNKLGYRIDSAKSLRALGVSVPPSAKGYRLTSEPAASA